MNKKPVWVAMEREENGIAWSVAPADKKGPNAPDIITSKCNCHHYKFKKKSISMAEESWGRHGGAPPGAFSWSVLNHTSYKVWRWHGIMIVCKHRHTQKYVDIKEMSHILSVCGWQIAYFHGVCLTCGILLQVNNTFEEGHSKRQIAWNLPFCLFGLKW